MKKTRSSLEFAFTSNDFGTKIIILNQTIDLDQYQFELF